jgi:serine/threonine-protein phosphatase 2A catalytic subunit
LPARHQPSDRYPLLLAFSLSHDDIMNNMDTNMEDVKMPEQHLIPQPPLEPTTIPILDSWIAGLLSCKQLAENDVQRLCEKVCLVYQARQLLMG